MAARILLSSALAAAAVGVLAGGASASQMIDRNASGVRLSVNTKGEALLSYRARGRLLHVLAWGAVDARHPTLGKPQARFKKDYSGGWGKYRSRYWQSFQNRCRPYTGPPLVFFVAACDGPDGSHWALQSWRTPLPDLGMTPWMPRQRTRELHLSHWTGPLAKIEVWTDWVYSPRFEHLFGRLTYDGKPVHGFRTTGSGAPLDGYGRLIYLDTFNSRYGPGWRRENSFVAHKPTGMFCYGFYQFDPILYPHPRGYPKAKRGPGTGSKYRLTVDGPGVTPDVSITIPGLHPFDRANPLDVAYELQQNAILDSMVGVDKLCRTH